MAPLPSPKPSDALAALRAALPSLVGDATRLRAPGDLGREGYSSDEVLRDLTAAVAVLDLAELADGRGPERVRRRRGEKSRGRV